MRITRGDLDTAVTRGLIQADQAHALWQFFTQQGCHQPSLQLSHLLYYFGGLMAIGAMTLFMTLGWELLGGAGIFMIASLYMLMAFVLTEYLLKHELRIPAGLTAALGVALVPLAIYGLQKALMLWPDDAFYRDYHDVISWRWILMEFATLAVGAVAFWRYRLPFLLLPIAVTLWYMSMDLAVFFFGLDLTWEMRRDFSLLFGLGMLALALGTDLRMGRNPDYAFWLYIFGMLAFWFGLSLRESDSEVAKFMYFMTNVGLLLVGTMLRRRVFVVLGAIGAFGYLGYLSYRIFDDSLLFPIFLSLVGFLIIGLGILWQRHEHHLGAKLRGYLPPRLRKAIEAGD